MRLTISSILKPLTLGLAMISIMALGQRVVKADEVGIAGYTNGCLNCNPLSVGNTSAAQTSSLFALAYVNSTFSGTTAGGFLGLTGNPIAPASQNVNNLGSFQLASSLANYTGQTFTLRVSFTVPAGINGAAVFSATLTANVFSTANGGVLIDFDNTPLTFTFSNATGSGSFNFSVNDLTISPGQVAQITAQVTAGGQTAMPEPASMLLLGTGLVGVATVARRRFKARS